MRIAFLRHGPTDWNTAGRFQGHTDIPLSTAGMAKMAGLRLPPDFAPARIFVSPLTRARQTALALGLPPATPDARLTEQNWGQWEGLTRAQILERHGDDAFANFGLGASFRPLGGESTGELNTRLAAFLEDVAQDKSDAVAVAHLGVLRAAYTLATGWDMATPMPADLDVSKILLLSLALDGTATVEALNVDFIPAASPRS
ncbi:MAG TPA: histidine phosphatase family protein [Rhizomicrobium sp.]|nr:histidine phosphatase family protein [Rhizomicrobium sp.]